MQLSMAGCVGFGFVWGWMVVLLGRAGKRPWRNTLILALVTTLPSVLVFLLFDEPHFLAFILATTFTVSLHLVWRYQRITRKTA